jgi:hypothetical protein
MDAFRLFAAGSRTWTDARLIFLDLDGFLSRHPEGLVIKHGGARGADRIVHHWCQRHPQVQVEVFEVTRLEWAAQGKAAGPRRSARIVNSGVDGMIAWMRGVSPGTRAAITIARNSGIPTWVRRMET